MKIAANEKVMPLIYSTSFLIVWPSWMRRKHFAYGAVAFVVVVLMQMI